jgi:hypothetical protein
MTKSISNTYLFISLMLPSVIFAGVESGKQAPNFSLTNEEGKSVELANYRGKTVVPYICLYMGFKGDITKKKATSTNWWFNKDFEVTQENWDFENEKFADILYVSFPSLKDRMFGA